MNQKKATCRFEEKVWKWLRDCECKSYNIKNVEDYDGFVSAVKKFIDVNKCFETGYVIEFNADFSKIKKWELV